jgi:hypothetical protein
MQTFARPSGIAAFAVLVSLLVVSNDAQALATITEFPVASAYGPGPIAGSANGYV